MLSQDNNLSGARPSRRWVGRFVLLLLLVPALMRSQTPALDHYDVRHGLPSNWIAAISQDADGRLWLGGDGGVCSYDGVSFTTYGSSAGVSSMVWAVVPSRFRPGTLYLGTHSLGLVRLKDDSAMTVTLGKKSGSETVSSVVEDSKGTLWCGTNGGVYVVRNDSSSFVSIDGETKPVSFLRELSDGSMLIGINRSLFLRRDSGDLEPLHVGSEGFVFTCVAEDKSGTLWLGTDDGTVVRVTGGSVTAILPTEGGALRTMAFDAQGTLWIAASFGLLRVPTSGFPGDGAVLFGTANGLRESDIFVAFVDRENNIWIGGRNHGLSKLSYLNIVSFQLDDVHPDLLNRTVAAGREGHLFAAGDNTIWEIWKGRDGFWQSHPHPVRSPSSFPSPDSLFGMGSMDVDRRGVLWMGFPHGGLRGYRVTYRDNSHSLVDPVYSIPPGGALPIGGSSGILVDDDDHLWYTQRGGIFARVDVPTRQVKQVFDNSRVIGTVRGISVDREGNVWVATFFGGVHILSRSGDSYTLARTLTEKDGLVSNRIRSIARRRNGETWLGTRFDGIVVYRDGVMRRISTSDGLLNNAVWCLAEDDEGRMWVGTSVGLQYTDPDGDRFSVHPRLQGGQVEGIGFIPGRKTLWCLLSGKLVVYEFGEDGDQTIRPLISISGFLVNGRSRDLNDEVILAHDENSCVIRFRGISLKDERGTRYRYRLLGSDTLWTDLADQRTVTFASLKPGSYTFEVSAISAGGIESSRNATASFVILPPWYSSPWSIGLYVVAGALLVVLYVKARTRALERRGHELERVVNARTAEVVEQRNKLREQADKLRELDSMKSHFFTNISHELRTPLTVILAHLDRLTGGETDLGLKDVRAMGRNARRLLQLVNQLLDLSKLEAGAMMVRAARVDITAFTRRVIASFASYAAHKAISLTFNGVPVEHEAGNPAIFLFVDRDKMEKVLSNLLSNALKFTPHGGKVDVSLSSGVREGPADAQLAELRVSDSGPGIPASDLPYVFDRFYQTTDTSRSGHGGTGVGLALVKELVELHHGTVHVDSTPGSGTTFTVRLPFGNAHLDEGEVVEEETVSEQSVHPEVPEADEIPVSRSATPDATDETSVLVVEDHADLRDVIRDQLRKEYRVLEASDGSDGIRKAKDHIPDLVISDVMMPGMDGYELCRVLKSDDRTDHIPVILLTAKATSDQRIKGLETGADDYLIKPFDPQELQVRVRNLIRMRRQLREKFSSEMLLRPSSVIVPSNQRIFLERVTRAIEERLEDESFNVEELGRAVGLSRAQLHRKLRALTNKAPNELIRSFRLQRAAELIRQESGTFAEIAYRVGFGSQAYFTRCFQEEFGRTPSEYRKNAAGSAGS